MPAAMPIENTELFQDLEEHFADMYAVFIHNDDVTTFETVQEALITHFDMTPKEAEDTAWQVHRKGKAVVGVFSKAEAEQKVLTLLGPKYKINASYAKA